jgi:hypothetical protein
MNNDLKPLEYGKMSTSFPTIQDQPLQAMTQQTRIVPRQTATGVTRGEQAIKGTIAVIDKNSTKRMLIGYKQGAF